MPPGAAVAEGLFGGVGADELLEHLLLGGGLGDALGTGGIWKSLAMVLTPSV